MFNILKKSSKITVDCFTVLDYVHDYTPIDYGTKFFPQWWKETPATCQENSNLTIKNCIGVIDFFKKSLVIPSWFQMDLTVYPINDPEKRFYSYESSNQHTRDTESHHKTQFEHFAENDGQNIKLTSPSCVKRNENVCFFHTLSLSLSYEQSQ
jgi:hypothetical protein